MSNPEGDSPPQPAAKGAASPTPTGPKPTSPPAQPDLMGRKPPVRPATPEENAFVSELEKIRSTKRIALILPPDRRPKPTEEVTVKRLIERIFFGLRKDELKITDLQPQMEQQRALARLDNAKKRETLVAILESTGATVPENATVDVLKAEIEKAIAEKRLAPAEFERLLESPPKPTPKAPEETLAKLARDVGKTRDETNREMKELRNELARADETLRTDIATRLSRTESRLEARFAAIEQRLADISRQGDTTPSGAQLNEVLEALYTFPLSEKPDSRTFGALLQHAKSRGIEPHAFLATARVATSLMDALRLARDLDWPLDAAHFYDVVKEVATPMTKTTAGYAIPVVRKAVATRLNITPDKFNELLLECKKVGYVQLTASEPLDRNAERGIDTGAAHLYYMTLRR